MPSFMLSCSCGKIAGAGRSGGTGIRARLKLVYPEGYEGSIPSFGIITRNIPLSGSSSRSAGQVDRQDEARLPVTCARKAFARPPISGLAFFCGLSLDCIPVKLD